jgi:FtsP/CotA-like multicopper oxidase with cupredoxin domain
MTKKLSNPEIPFNQTKVHRYPNSQNPGNLWYHDHSMTLTTYNVGHGLSGYYILRNKDV